MPSRMLVAATAATSSPDEPAERRTSRMQAVIAVQLASTSKSWPPGASGGSRWVHSRSETATCSPERPNSSARQLPVPASTASRKGLIGLASLAGRRAGGTQASTALSAGGVAAEGGRVSPCGLLAGENFGVLTLAPPTPQHPAS